MENAGPGSRGVENTGKTRVLVENTGSGGKHRVWKTRGVENTGSGGKKRGVSRKHGVKVKNTREPLFRPRIKFPRQHEKSKFCYFKLQ